MASRTKDEPSGEHATQPGNLEATLALGNPADPPPWTRPETIGRYRILDELGRGGMGVVYEAHDPSLDRTVAVKLVTPSRSSPDARARLAREARTLARLSHPNVVEVFEIGEHGEQLFIAMELVRGSDVRRWKLRHDPSLEQIVRVFVDAARGLAAAHAVGLVHRDLKPDNVMVGDDGRVRVLDFGLARPIGAGSSGSDSGYSSNSLTESDIETLGADGADYDDRLTQTGMTMGTPAYMAPEQFQAIDDDRTDQFALAISLFELLIGHRPFMARSYEGLAKATSSGTITEPEEHDVPRPLMRVLRRALSPAPDDRFRDMHHMIAALEPFAGLPRSRRSSTTRWLFFGSVVLATVGVGLGAWWSRPAKAACPSKEALFAELWGESPRARARNAILGTQVAYAESTWTEVDGRLQDYATGWSAARHETCEVMREDPAAALDERLACLDGRRVAVLAVADVLAQADATTVHNASRTVARLPPVQGCRERSEYRDDGSDGPEYERVRSRLAAATASYDIGRYADGIIRLDQADHELGSDPPGRLASSVALMRGRLTQALGQSLPAARAYESAYFTALASDRQDIACRAASHLAAEPAIPYRERWQWAGHAKAALDRHGDDETLKHAYERSMCVLQSDSGQLDEAIERCERALSLVETRVPADPPARAQAMADLGAVLAVAGRWTQAHELWQRALTLSEQVWGPDHPAVATAANELGVTARELGDRAQARTLAQRALSIREASLGPDHPDLLFAEDLLGELDRDETRYEQGYQRAQRALARRRELYGETHPLVVRSLYTVALALEDLGRFDEALAAMQEVWQLEHQLHPLNIRRIDTLREQARMAYEIGGGPGEGIRYLEQAWDIVRKSEIPDDHPVVRDLWHGYGETLLALGRAEQGLVYLERFVADPRPSPILPHLKYVLARALVAAGRDKSRAVALVRESIEAWKDSTAPFHVFQVADMQVWLEEHATQP